MSRSRFVSAGFACALSACITILPGAGVNVASAQQAVLNEMFGAGVHAYYANDYSRAYDALTRAIDGGINDPRAYYFRGLTNATTGRPAEAEEDFRSGAELEAVGNFGASVSRTLTRVQGPQRIEIERFRTQARLQAQAEGVARSERRYSELRQSEESVLRRPPQPKTPPEIPGTRSILPPADGPTPFDDESLATGEPQVQAEDALEGTMDDPFADDAPAQPADAAEAGSDPSEDPFGAPADNDDPFGGDPFGAPADADDDDPFGGDPFGS